MRTRGVLRRLRLGGALLLFGAVLPGCGRDDAAPATPDEAAWQSCTHDQAGVVVEYPPGWVTNDGAVMPTCMLFDPVPIMVPYASEVPEDIAVSLHVEPVAYDVISTSTFGIRILSSEPVTVAGRPGVRRLVEHTGDGMFDRGVRTWQYLVAWADETTLMASSNDTGEPAFEEKLRVLDEMMERLRRR
jgi:hypothetical protein